MNMTSKLNITDRAAATMRLGLGLLVCPIALIGVSSQAAAQTALDQAISWDDGLSEMSYYDATDTLYGKSRRFTRVQMTNRQWMSGESGVKAEEGPNSIPVYKFVISEEIPTENYNYRYLTTMFLGRQDLAPFKLTSTSQEWCGTTFKHLRWSTDEMTYLSFSYFGDEGDHVWHPPVSAVPFQALFLLSREVVASGKPMELLVLPSVRSNHQIAPEPFKAKLSAEKESTQLTVPMGSVQATRVTLTSSASAAWFDVESKPPHRLLAFDAGGVTGRLKGVERRAYWNRSKPSQHYLQNKAP